MRLATACVAALLLLLCASAVRAKPHVTSAADIAVLTNVDSRESREADYGHGIPPYFHGVDVLIKNRGAHDVPLADLSVSYFIGVAPGSAARYGAFVWFARNDGDAEAAGEVEFKDRVTVAFEECGEGLTWSPPEQNGTRVAMRLGFDGGVLGAGADAWIRIRLSKQVWPREPLDDAPAWSQLYDDGVPAAQVQRLVAAPGQEPVAMAANARAPAFLRSGAGSDDPASWRVWGETPFQEPSQGTPWPAVHAPGACVLREGVRRVHLRTPNYARHLYDGAGRGDDDEGHGMIRRLLAAGGPNPVPNPPSSSPFPSSSLHAAPADGAPVVRLRGGHRVNGKALLLGEAFEDPGAIAIGGNGGNGENGGDGRDWVGAVTTRTCRLGAGCVAVPAVDPHTPGTYVIRYDATNSRGVQAAPKLRIVRVLSERASADAAARRVLLAEAAPGQAPGQGLGLGTAAVSGTGAGGQGGTGPARVCTDLVRSNDLQVDVSFDASLPQLHYARVAIRNGGNAPLNLGDYAMPFAFNPESPSGGPYFQGEAQLTPRAACTNPIVVAAGGNQAAGACPVIGIGVDAGAGAGAGIGGPSTLSSSVLSPSAPHIVVTFAENMTLCPGCEIDGMGKARSLFDVHDAMWQSLGSRGSLTLQSPYCKSTGARIPPRSSPERMARLEEEAGQCRSIDNTEYSGRVLSLSALKAESAAACCALCREEMNCNVWTWCGGSACARDVYRSCVLKYESKGAPQIVSRGGYTPWTSGFMGQTFATLAPSPAQAQAQALAHIPEDTFVAKSNGGRGAPGCDARSVLSDIRVGTNNGQQVFVTGTILNNGQSPAVLSGYTVPLHYSLAVIGPNGEWYRAHPEEFVVECVGASIARPGDPVGAATDLGCDQIVTDVSETGIHMTFKNTELCPGCFVASKTNLPIVAVAHARALPMDHANVFVGTPYCRTGGGANSGKGPGAGVGAGTDSASLQERRQQGSAASTEAAAQAPSSPIPGAIPNAHTLAPAMQEASDPDLPIGGAPSVPPLQESSADLNSDLNVGAQEPPPFPGGAGVGAGFATLRPAERANALRQATAEEASKILLDVGESDAAATMDEMPVDAVVDVLFTMDFDTAAALLARMAPPSSAAALAQMTPQQSQSLLAGVSSMMEPHIASQALMQLYPRQAANTLRSMALNDAAAIIEVTPPADAGRILGSMPGDAVAEMLMHVRPSTGAAFLEYIPSSIGAEALALLPQPDVDFLLSRVGRHKAASLRQARRNGRNRPSYASFATPPATAGAGRGGGGTGMARIAQTPETQTLGKVPSFPAPTFQGNATGAFTGTPRALATVPPTMTLGKLHPSQGPSQEEVEVLMRATPSAAAQTLRAMGSPHDAAQALQRIPGERIAQILAHIDPEDASAIMEDIPADLRVLVKNLMGAQRGLRGLGGMGGAGNERGGVRPDPQIASHARALSRLPPKQAATALRSLTVKQAAQVMQAMESLEDAGAIMGEVPSGAVANMLQEMRPSVASALLVHLPSDLAVDVFLVLPRAEVDALLSRVDPRKASRIKAAVALVAQKQRQHDEDGHTHANNNERQGPAGGASGGGNPNPGSSRQPGYMGGEPTYDDYKASALNKGVPLVERYTTPAYPTHRVSEGGSWPAQSAGDGGMQSSPPADLLEGKSPKEAALALRQMGGPDDAARALETVGTAEASQIVAAMPDPRDAAAILSKMDATKLTGIERTLSRMKPKKAKAVFDHMDDDRGGAENGAGGSLQTSTYPPEEGLQQRGMVIEPMQSSGTYGFAHAPSQGLQQSTRQWDAAAHPNDLGGGAQGELHPFYSASEQQQQLQEQEQKQWGADLSNSSPSAAAQALKRMPSAKAASDALNTMTAAQAATIVGQLHPDDAARVVDLLSTAAIAELLSAADERVASALLERMTPSSSAGALAAMEPVEMMQLLASVSLSTGSAIQNAFPPASVGPKQIAYMTPRFVSETLSQLHAEQAASALRSMTADEAARIVMAINPVDAAKMLKEMPREVAESIIDALPEVQGQMLRTEFFIHDEAQPIDTPWNYEAAEATPQQSTATAQLAQRMEAAELASYIQTLTVEEAELVLRSMGDIQKAAGKSNASERLIPHRQVSLPPSAWQPTDTSTRAAVMDLLPAGAASEILAATTRDFAAGLLSDMNSIASASSISLMNDAVQAQVRPLP